MIVQNFVLTPVALSSLQKAKKDNAKKKEKEEKDRKAKERAVSILNFTMRSRYFFIASLLSIIHFPAVKHRLYKSSFCYRVSPVVVSIPLSSRC